MWGALIAVAASVLSNMMASSAAKKAEAEREQYAKRQQIMAMRQKLAQEIAPGAPSYGGDAAQFKLGQDEQRRQFGLQNDERQRQLFAGILPAAVSAFGNAWSNQPPSSQQIDQSILNRWDKQDDFQVPAWRGWDGS